MTRRSYSATAVATKLVTGIGAADTSMVIVDATGWPDGTGGPFIVTLKRGQSGEEKTLATTRSGTTVSGLTRGYEGTTAGTHEANEAVEHTLSKTDLDEANAHINDTTLDQHTQYALVKKGLAALRAAIAHRSMQLHLSTDTSILGVDDGAAWVDFQSKAAADAAYQSLAGPKYASVATGETTASTSFTDLTTPGPAVTVVVGASGRVKVTIGAALSNSNAGSENYMHVALTSGNTRAAANDDAENYTFLASTAGYLHRASRTFVISGLAPGSTVFTAKYRVTGGTGTFGGRTLLVEPL